MNYKEMLNMPFRILKSGFLTQYSVYRSIMKRLLYTVLLIILPLFKSSSRTIIPAKGASKYIGKTVTITGKVFGSKTETPSGVVLLYMDGYGPIQDIII